MISTTLFSAACSEPEISSTLEFAVESIKVSTSPFAWLICQQMPVGPRTAKDGLSYMSQRSKVVLPPFKMEILPTEKGKDSCARALWDTEASNRIENVALKEGV